MTQPQLHVSLDRTLSLRDTLIPLVKSRLVPAAEAEKWLRLWARSSEHPLSLLADVTIPDPRNPSKNVTFDEIAAIVARSFGLEYQRVDPVKVNLEVVGTLIPHAYAERLGIVAVAMDDKKVVIVTAEPTVTSWVDEIAAQTR